MIGKPSYIPCVTGRAKADNKVHLISPKPGMELLRAEELTIVDCRTYGLRLNRHIDPVEHYLWYIDFVKDFSFDRSLVFVAPDWDWINSRSVVEDLSTMWIQTSRVAQLVVPETFLFDKVDPSLVVGYALQRGQHYSHPEWVHSFSQDYDPQPKETKLWTYDSLSTSLALKS